MVEVNLHRVLRIIQLIGLSQATFLQAPAQENQGVQFPDAVCPCLPHHECPKVFGSIPEDEVLGTFPPCRIDGFVRCCGLSSSGRHERNSRYNEPDPFLHGDNVPKEMQRPGTREQLVTAEARSRQIFDLPEGIVAPVAFVYPEYVDPRTVKEDDEIQAEVDIPEISGQTGKNSPDNIEYKDPRTVKQDGEIQAGVEIPEMAEPIVKNLPDDIVPPMIFVYPEYVDHRMLKSMEADGVGTGSLKLVENMSDMTDTQKTDLPETVGGSFETDEFRAKPDNGIPRAADVIYETEILSEAPKSQSAQMRTAETQNPNTHDKVSELRNLPADIIVPVAFVYPEYIDYRTVNGSPFDEDNQQEQTNFDVPENNGHNVATSEDEEPMVVLPESEITQVSSLTTDHNQHIQSQAQDVVMKANETKDSPFDENQNTGDIGNDLKIGVQDSETFGIPDKSSSLEDFAVENVEPFPIKLRAPMPTADRINQAGLKSFGALYRNNYPSGDGGYYIPVRVTGDGATATDEFDSKPEVATGDEFDSQPEVANVHRIQMPGNANEGSEKRDGGERVPAYTTDTDTNKENQSRTYSITMTVGDTNGQRLEQPEKNVATGLQPSIKYQPTDRPADVNIENRQRHVATLRRRPQGRYVSSAIAIPRHQDLQRQELSRINDERGDHQTNAADAVRTIPQSSNKQEFSKQEDHAEIQDDGNDYKNVDHRVPEVSSSPIAIKEVSMDPIVINHQGIDDRGYHMRVTVNGSVAAEFDSKPKVTSLPREQRLGHNKESVERNARKKVSPNTAATDSFDENSGNPSPTYSIKMTVGDVSSQGLEQRQRNLGRGTGGLVNGNIGQRQKHVTPHGGSPRRYVPAMEVHRRQNLRRLELFRQNKKIENHQTDAAGAVVSRSQSFDKQEFLRPGDKDGIRNNDNGHRNVDYPVSGESSGPIDENQVAIGKDLLYPIGISHHDIGDPEIVEALSNFGEKKVKFGTRLANRDPMTPAGSKFKIPSVSSGWAEATSREKFQRQRTLSETFTLDEVSAQLDSNRGTKPSVPVNVDATIDQRPINNRIKNLPLPVLHGDAERETSVEKLVLPTAEEVSPSADEVHPTADEVHPTADEVYPTDEVRPTADEVHPTIDEVHPIAEEVLLQSTPEPPTTSSPLEIDKSKETVNVSEEESFTQETPRINSSPWKTNSRKTPVVATDDDDRLRKSTDMDNGNSQDIRYFRGIVKRPKSKDDTANAGSGSPPDGKAVDDLNMRYFISQKPGPIRTTTVAPIVNTKIFESSKTLVPRRPSRITVRRRTLQDQETDAFGINDQEIDGTVGNARQRILRMTSVDAINHEQESSNEYDESKQKRFKILAALRKKRLNLLRETLFPSLSSVETILSRDTLFSATSTPEVAVPEINTPTEVKSIIPNSPISDAQYIPRMESFGIDTINRSSTTPERSLEIETEGSGDLNSANKSLVAELNAPSDSKPLLSDATKEKENNTENASRIESHPIADQISSYVKTEVDYSDDLEGVENKKTVQVEENTSPKLRVQEEPKEEESGRANGPDDENKESQASRSSEIDERPTSKSIDDLSSDVKKFSDEPSNLQNVESKLKIVMKDSLPKDTLPDFPPISVFHPDYFETRTSRSERNSRQIGNEEFRRFQQFESVTISPDELSRPGRISIIGLIPSGFKDIAISPEAELSLDLPDEDSHGSFRSAPNFRSIRDFPEPWRPTPIPLERMIPFSRESLRPVARSLPPFKASPVDPFQ